ncbi:RpiR family transcriptional regulator [Maritimibacter alkaliphilus HTCC2654]|uniref:Putative transcriptional regulator protein n=1 Tax=Maritimibacter alkaliphilus HTCC2654 TaxID=314271 RepID=A3VFQ4_9RHOB|nr:putative transcriptional regulator protein [Rhodobacterales bacterium HTCC2654] [Maritimibacter alkaliphilus HTCC2654]TYP83939.1 RpiR family transcriptional regulator [Maritimibacter alkaliphilus HTCC2654]
MASNYDALSARLREAGDYIAANPLDTATRSLRAVADHSGLAPATFTRLSKALGYENFEELREGMRRRLERRQASFAARADALQGASDGGSADLIRRTREASLTNIDRLTDEIDTAKFDTIADHLHAARRVVLLGGLGSTAIAEYAAYMGNFLGDNWMPAGRMGASVGAALSDLDRRDALIVFTKPPFANTSIRAAEFARARGVYVLVVTDTHTCPALRHASARVVVPTESPNFFSSYVATMFFVETLMAMIAQRAGPTATERIADVETANRALGEVIGL